MNRYYKMRLEFDIATGSCLDYKNKITSNITIKKVTNLIKDL